MGEKNLDVLIKTMAPVLNKGDYVFCSINNLTEFNIEDILCLFREKEGISILINKLLADKLNLPYTSILSWITLTVHSSLEAVGLTATFSKALADEGISCNVIAAYYHDHIFVGKDDAIKAINILQQLASKSD